ncbi:MAG TPA: hypothetical protein VKE27_13165, partial [Candidatus Dormibacteraeota bacterium]|nr:hypothetical protein [Candidatus Dormibacteraeota bacterium]
WVREDLPVALEFPGSGEDIRRTIDLDIEGLKVRLISCEDLYLDRMRQATVAWPREDVSFDSALAIALANYREMDWPYISLAIRAAAKSSPRVGESMKAVSRRIRARARRAVVAVTMP